MYAGLAIYDTMQFIKPDVSTICVGHRDEHGRPAARRRRQGKRMALPNSKILIHQVWGGFQGQASDIEIHARETICAQAPARGDHGQSTPARPSRRCAQDMDRDFFMTSEEAKEYGIIDQVIVKR